MVWHLSSIQIEHWHFLKIRALVNYDRLSKAFAQSRIVVFGDVMDRGTLPR